MDYKEQLEKITDLELLVAYQESYYPESIFEEMVIRLFKEKIKKDSEKCENSENWVL